MVGRRKKRRDLPQRVYFNRGWYWWVEPGSNRWHKLGKEFDLAARLKWAELTGSDPHAGQPVTVGRMLDAYIRAAESGQLPAQISDRTIADSKAHKVQLCRIFGQMNPDHVTPNDVALYLRRRKGPNGKPARVRANREIATLSSAYSWGMAEGFAANNPTFGVRRNKETPKRHAPTLQEIRAVQRHASPKWAAIIEIGLLLGQRGVDLRTLKKQQISAAGIEFQQSKRGARVLIEWTPQLRAAFKALQEVTSRSKTLSMYVIPARNGQAYTADGWKSNMYKAVTRAIDAGDLTKRFSFHQLRAANATIDDQQGGKPQKRLGHTTEKQTADYIRGRTATRVKPLKFSS